MYSPPSRGQWRAAGKSRMSTLSSRRWFSCTGVPSPSTTTGGIGLPSFVLHRRISSMTGSPAGSPMARANRSTLEPRGFQSARKPPPRLLLERILDRTPAASRQASPRHVEIDRVLLLALVPILVELGLPVLRMERVAVVARAPGQEHQRTEKCEPCNRHRAPP